MHNIEHNDITTRHDKESWELSCIFCIPCGYSHEFSSSLFFGYSLKDQSTNIHPEYLHDLSNLEYTSSLVAGISANLPILVMYFFDGFLRRIGSYGSSLSNKVEKTASSVYVPLRESVIFLMVSDILLLFWLIPSKHYELMMLLLDARDTMYTYSILTCLAKFSNPVWTSTSVMLIGVPLMVSNVLVSFQTLTDPVIVTAALITFTSLGLLSLLVYVLRWIRYIAHLDIEEVSSTDTILCSTYVLFLCTFLIGNRTVSYIPSTAGDP